MVKTYLISKATIPYNFFCASYASPMFENHRCMKKFKFLQFFDFRKMHHRMYRIFRTIQTPSCRRFSSRTNPFSNGTRIPKPLSKAAPIGAAAFMLGGAILFKNKNAKEEVSATDSNSETKIYTLKASFPIKRIVRSTCFVGIY